jgi:serine/threonine protein phosphatase PrpC
MTHERLALDGSVGTDVGLHRGHNEDSAYRSPRLLAVADGMGGHAHGEVASAVVIAALADLDSSLSGADLTAIDLLAALSAVVPDMRRRIDELAGADQDLLGMGTTLTALLFDGSRLAVAHIGDSRGYLLRDGALIPITRDHTLVQSLIDEGKLTEAEGEAHPRRSVLVRALQTGGTADADLTMRTVRAGDRYLLCSDGLTDMAPIEDIHATLADVEDRDEAISQLIDLANSHGGQDNITCVVADARPGEPGSGDGVLIGAAANRPAERRPTIPGWLMNLLRG